VNDERSDDRDTFRQWVEPLLNQAAGYAYAIVGNHADVEDAVQESLWKAYRSLHRYDRGRPFRGWWFAIVRNCCLDLLGQRRSRPRTVSLDDAARVTARATREADSLREAIAKLTPEHRGILELRYFGGCSYRDLAEALTIPAGTVMSRLHAARLALAAAYGKDL
jgi:RNA polymerase sigma-70 factor (ECF subfamily)